MIHSVRGFCGKPGRARTVKGRFDKQLSSRTKKWVAETGGITRERVPIAIGSGKPDRA